MNRQHGFNIIEMMVGLTIGLLGLLAVTQVFINFNKQRNTTTQALEAQSNGTMALFLMERDLTQAGYGLLPLSTCSDADNAVDADGDGVANNDHQIFWYWNPPAVPPSVVQPCAATQCGLQPALTTAPIIITPGVTDTDSDSLQIQYAKSVSGSPGAILSEPQTVFTDPFKLESVAGFSVGDMVVANVVVGSANRCSMSQITAVNDDSPAAVADKFTLEHAASDYNPSGPSSPAANGWVIAPKGTMLANVGTYVSKNYFIEDNSLKVAQFPATNTNDVAADGIVLMKAQYGKDTNLDGAVDEWTNSVITDYKAIIAVRVGVIARSPLLEKEEVEAPDTLVVLPKIFDGSGTAIGAEIAYPLTDAEKHYRYKSYYTVVPIRNVIWSQ